MDHTFTSVEADWQDLISGLTLLRLGAKGANSPKMNDSITEVSICLAMALDNQRVDEMKPAVRQILKRHVGHLHGTKTFVGNFRTGRSDVDQ